MGDAGRTMMGRERDDRHAYPALLIARHQVTTAYKTEFFLIYKTQFWPPKTLRHVSTNVLKIYEGVRK